eukprot:scaffold39984_cov51-Cyclotella_meneghiniana.AAC.2
MTRVVVDVDNVMGDGRLFQASVVCNVSAVGMFVFTVDSFSGDRSYFLDDRKLSIADAIGDSCPIILILLEFCRLLE